MKPLLHSYLAKNTIEFDTHPSIPPAVPSSSTVLSFLSFDAQPPILTDSFLFNYFELFLKCLCFGFITIFNLYFFGIWRFFFRVKVEKNLTIIKLNFD